MSSRLMIDLPGLFLEPGDEALLLRPEVGGVILFSRNYRDASQLKQLVRSIRGLKPGVLLAVDQEGGRVQRLTRGFQKLPPLGRIGKLAEQDEEQAVMAARSLAWLMAAEVISHGLDISFAPVLDLDTDRSRVIGDRAFGDEPARVSRLARAYVQGMHMAGMAATGKHFPGHGGVVEDSHLELPVDSREFEQLWERDMLPFRQLLGDLDALMSAHIRFDRVDGELVSFSSLWLRDILRDRMGYRGRVFSDDLSMEGAAGAGSYRDRAAAAVEAGCDMLILCNNRAGAIEVADWLAGQKALSPLDWTSMRAKRVWNADSISDHPWYEEALQFLEILHDGENPES